MIKPLSKSLYIKGLQCQKLLWLSKYQKEVLTPPDATKEEIFATGDRVGKLATELFPNGKEILYHDSSFSEKIALTQQYIDEGVKSIYEATFVFENVLVMVDILHQGEQGWEIHEVKSATGVKEVYLQDAAIQYYVLQGCGLDIASVNIVHVNNQYIRGETLALEELFKTVDVTKEILDLQDTIPTQLQTCDVTLQKEQAPDIDIGLHCLHPYTCDAKEHCWKHIPKQSIFEIGGLRNKKKFELYDRGIIMIEDIPKEMDFSDAQKIEIASVQQNKTIIDKMAIKNFLETLSYPIYHLDFESFQQAIPEYEGLKPFEQIPFQYSLHIEHEDGRIEHKAFLAQAGKDPRETLAYTLIEDIATDGTVLAYNMHFEKGVIKNLAATFPEISKDLMRIHANIKDLMTPFKKKAYYTPTMRGSHSIKYVLPALVPEMVDAYKSLDGVQNGGEAMTAFANLSSLEGVEEVERVRKALLAYCELDTLAMVKILERLRKTISVE